MLKTAGLTTGSGSRRLDNLIGVQDPPMLLERPGADAPYDDDGGTIVCIHGDGPPRWLVGAGARVLARPAATSVTGEVFAQLRTAAGEAFDCVDLHDGVVALPFSLTEAYENFVLERWVPSRGGRRLSERTLDLYYRLKPLMPRSLQLAIRRRWTAFKGTPEFPRWPHDDSVERLVRFYGTCVLRALQRESTGFRWFWPNGMHAAAILTHDIEGDSGMRNALRIAELEEGYGLRSSFNVVGDWYPIDWGVLRELAARGHEIGSHALYHDRSLFSDRLSFERQLPLLHEAVARLEAVGFRSPATHRVPEWIAELPVDYDTTVPLSDPYEAQPGGACSVWPFFIGDVLELPYTLPQDHTLFTLMGHRDATAWIAQLLRVERSFGLIQCVSHPDAGYLGDRRKEAIYRAFLHALVSREKVWHALPRDVARWWRARADGQGLPGLCLVTGTLVRPPDGVLAELCPPPDPADA